MKSLLRQHPLPLNRWGQHEVLWSDQTRRCPHVTVTRSLLQAIIHCLPGTLLVISCAYSLSTSRTCWSQYAQLCPPGS